MIEDAPFVLLTWRTSFRKGSDWAKRMILSVYEEFHQEVMRRILARPTTQVFVACNPDAPVVIYGYMVAEFNESLRRPVVHYIFVKEPFRRLGIAKGLITASQLNPLCLYFTHHTRDRRDLKVDSPTYGQLRWPGSETLLRKWPEAHERWDPRAKKLTFTDGNIWVPYLI